MTRQRSLFLGIITLALIAIWIFAYIFTGKLLNPIEASRLRQNQFIASASHELRTPLAVILSCAEAGLDKDVCPELSTIKNEALRTSRLLNDMLTLLSCDTGHLDIKPVRTQLDTLVLNACEAFENMAASKISKSAPPSPKMHSPTAYVTVSASHKCSQSFCTMPSAIRRRAEKICLSADYVNKHFEIKISDTGVGISDEDKSKIFDRFYRSEKKPAVTKITSGWVSPSPTISLPHITEVSKYPTHRAAAAPF